LRAERKIHGEHSRSAKSNTYQNELGSDSTIWKLSAPQLNRHPLAAKNIMIRILKIIAIIILSVGWLIRRIFA